MKIKSAFPIPVEHETKGMSLQQWYAGMAMQGLLASGKYKDTEATILACAANKIATAMVDIKK